MTQQNLINDRYFDVQVLTKTERPNLIAYMAMHQCYSEIPIMSELDKIAKLSDEELGDRVVKHCIKFGHWSVIEHPTITFVVSGYPHSVMAQSTRHRHLSFSVQSQRYTGERILGLFENDYDELESIFYCRPEGDYFDREGKKYYYSQENREQDLIKTFELASFFIDKYYNGFALEHARDLLPQNIRQDFVVTFNARSLLHFCDLRLPKDAQLEIRDLATRLFAHFKEWMPEVAEYYENNRLGKNKLAP